MRGGLAGDSRARVPAFFPCFDGLRAIAALTVFGVHFAGKTGLSARHGHGAFQRLDVGVAIFFVISGFLLYRPFAVAHFGELPAPRYGAFMKRRVLRIFPAYWVALTILVLAGEVHQVSGWGIPAYYGLVHVYFPAYALGGLGQSWTLCTEMTFYLLLPVYAWLVGRRRREPDRPAPHRAARVARPVPLGLRLRDGDRLCRCVRVVPDRAVAAGQGRPLCARDVARRRRHVARRASDAAHLRRGRASPCPCGVGRGGVGVLGRRDPCPRAARTTVRVVNEIELLYGLIAFFLVLPAVAGATEGGLVRRFLRSRPMLLLGLISYGIYLWHLLAIHLVLRAAGARTGFLVVGWDHGGPSYVPMLVKSLTLTLALAALSYVLIERPFLRLKGRPLRPRGTLWPRGTASAPEPALPEPGAWRRYGRAMGQPLRSRSRPLTRRTVPSLTNERAPWAEGHDVVAGIDEVGRGAWAGPISVGAAVLPSDRRVYRVRDSKMLDEAERERLFDRIASWCRAWSVGHASQEECDTLGMSAAQRLAARRAVAGLGLTVDAVLVDGNWDFVGHARTRRLVRGDATCLSIATASILAKVTRDRPIARRGRALPRLRLRPQQGLSVPAAQVGARGLRSDVDPPPHLGVHGPHPVGRRAPPFGSGGALVAATRWVAVACAVRSRVPAVVVATTRRPAGPARSATAFRADPHRRSDHRGLRHRVRAARVLRRRHVDTAGLRRRPGACDRRAARCAGPLHQLHRPRRAPACARRGSVRRRDVGHVRHAGAPGRGRHLHRLPHERDVDPRAEGQSERP